MPLAPPVNPNAPKKVTWLELFFDLIFALALSMSAKSLEHVGDLSTSSLLALGEFILIFVFLVIFWYRHMVLINRFAYSSFLLSLITLFMGFLVIAFTQFIRMWRIEADLGSFLATITISLVTLSLAGIYFLASIRIQEGGTNEKIWSRAVSKHMLWESMAYLGALLVSAGIRPFWFILVFIYFNRAPFETYINPKKISTLDPALTTLPAENVPHKAERLGLFALLIYGLVIVLAATPLLQIVSISSVDQILGPILNFAQIFFFISLIWYIHYRVFEVCKPKGNQFTVLTFITLALLVATTHFIKIMLVNPSVFVSTAFAVSTALMLTVIAIVFWNIKTIAGGTDIILKAFRQWSLLLYISAAAFFASTLFPSPIKEIIWKIIAIVLFVFALFEGRLNEYYVKTTESKKVLRFLDNQTVSGLALIVTGVIIFFVITALLGKSIASWWIFTWLAPVLVGFFVILNHWLHTRIKPN